MGFLDLFRAPPAPAPASSAHTPPDKRAIRVARIEAHIAKLIRKDTPESLRKAAEHQRELEALALEERIAELRSGVVVRPGPATLEVNDGRR